MKKRTSHINKLSLAKAIACLLLFIPVFHIKASTPESKNTTNRSVYQEYIKTHHQTAIQQQKKHKIPASIILAQALLESGAGQSYLALAGNNHFGIKCAEWKGLCVYKKDDGMRSCFRKYLHVNQSFDDHSRFLVNRPHYKPLFKLKPTDYKGWANGLKKYGYATDPQYASKLIKIIEEYKLHQYDLTKETASPASTKKAAAPTTKKTPASKPKAAAAQPAKNNTTAKKPATTSSSKPKTQQTNKNASSAKK